jgi:ATP-dependent Clp protease adaptor protein ClpS
LGLGTYKKSKNEMDDKRKKLEKYVSILSNAGEKKLYYPSMYEIILKHKNNQCRDTFYFILASVFRKTDEESAKSIIELEESGHISCGVYTKEVAETKILTATECAFENGGTLKFIMRKGKHNVIEKS